MHETVGSIFIYMYYYKAWTNSLPNIFPPVIFDTPDILPPVIFPPRTCSLPQFFPTRTYSLQSFFHPRHILSRSFSTLDIFPPVINLKMPFALLPLITQNAVNIEGIIFQLLKKLCKISYMQLTGYNQSITSCGSQRKQCSCYSTKTNVNSNLI